MNSVVIKTIYIFNYRFQIPLKKIGLYPDERLECVRAVDNDVDCTKINILLRDFVFKYFYEVNSERRLYRNRG